MSWSYDITVKPRRKILKPQVKSEAFDFMKPNIKKFWYSETPSEETIYWALYSPNEGENWTDRKLLKPKKLKPKKLKPKKPTH